MSETPPPPTSGGNNKFSVGERRNAKPMKLDLFKFKKMKKQNSDASLVDGSGDTQQPSTTADNTVEKQQRPSPSTSTRARTQTSPTKRTSKPATKTNTNRGAQRNNEHSTLPAGEYLLLLPDFMKQRTTLHVHHGAVSSTATTPVVDDDDASAVVPLPSLVPSRSIATSFRAAFQYKTPAAAKTTSHLPTPSFGGVSSLPPSATTVVQPLSVSPDVLRQQAARSLVKKSHLQSPSLHAMQAPPGASTPGSFGSLDSGRSPTMHPSGGGGSGGAYQLPRPPTANSIWSERQAKRDSELDPCCPIRPKCCLGAPTVISTSTITAGLLQLVVSEAEQQCNVCYVQQLAHLAAAGSELLSAGDGQSPTTRSHHQFPISVDALRFLLHRMLLNFSSSLDKNICTELLRRVEQQWTLMKAGRFGCKVHRVIFQESSPAGDQLHHQTNMRLRRVSRKKRQEALAAEQQLHTLQDWCTSVLDYRAIEKEYLIDMSNSAALIPQKHKNTSGTRTPPPSAFLAQDGETPNVASVPSLLMPPSTASGVTVDVASTPLGRGTEPAKKGVSSTGRRKPAASSTTTATEKAKKKAQPRSLSGTPAGGSLSGVPQVAKQYELVDPTWTDIDMADACRLIQERWSSADGAVGFLALVNDAQEHSGGSHHRKKKLKAVKVLSPSKLANLMETNSRYIQSVSQDQRLAEGVTPMQRSGGVSSSASRYSLAGVSPVVATTDATDEGMLGPAGSLSSGGPTMSTMTLRPSSGLGSRTMVLGGVGHAADVKPILCIHSTIKRVLNPEEDEGVGNGWDWVPATDFIVEGVGHSGGVDGVKPGSGSKSDLTSQTDDDAASSLGRNALEDGDVVKAISKSWRRGKKRQKRKRELQLLGQRNTATSQQPAAETVFDLMPVYDSSCGPIVNTNAPVVAGRESVDAVVEGDGNDPSDDSGKHDDDDVEVFLAGETTLLGMCKDGAYDLDELLVEVAAAGQAPFSPTAAQSSPTSRSLGGAARLQDLEVQRRRIAAARNGNQVADNDRNFILPIAAAQMPISHSRLSKIVAEQQQQSSDEQESASSMATVHPLLLATNVPQLYRPKPTRPK